MPRVSVAALACLLVGGSGLAAACGSDFSAGAAGDDGGADASVEAAGDSSGPAHDGPSADGGDDDAAPVAIVYVSSVGGDDANDGLSPAKAKKTIAAGLVAAAKAGAGAEVHVCKGVYVESALNLGAPVSLLGSWDCASWTRTASYGFPTFDGVNATTIQNGNAAAQVATLVVSGSVPATSVIDGFQIQGASGASAPSAGIAIGDQASPVVRNDVVTGGGGNGGANPGSVGVLVSSGASPEITHDVILGGSGTGTVGSVGVALSTTGAPLVHDNKISGGTGAPSTVGVSVYSSIGGPKGLARNVVSGSDSAITGDSIAVLIGLPNAQVEILDSDLLGGSGTGPKTASAAVSVKASNATVQIAGCRIHGGTRTGASSQTFGVIAEAAGSLSIVDSYVHAGAIQAGTQSNTEGIEIQSGKVQIAFDTIYTGAAAGVGIALLTGTASAAIIDDLLLGGNAGNYGVVASACTGVVTTFDHDVFANFDAALYQCGSGATVQGATSITQLAALFPSAASDRIVEDPTRCTVATDTPYCVADTSCPGASATCMPSIFGASWSTSDDGVAGLFPSSSGDAGTVAGGWTLRSPAPCAVAQGGTPVTGITTDAFGSPRSASTPTVGAAEYAGACAH